ncbi:MULTISPECIES: hypothetical protein [unclassified Bacillus (in: firmicutes)]|uniref:hypothetical protein n=1 Tax=unclassified Bacillus (in: firmicutes) TaxID=185979 RepID=UPI0008EC3147|nr:MULTISPECIES: hypothetical protein [unclassified Bacillus (in: firmicutes)]SFD17271.1 hypothetical protein SAMN02799633_02858 [Bacillus sp. UNCCL81]
MESINLSQQQLIDILKLFYYRGSHSNELNTIDFINDMKNTIIMISTNNLVEMK